MADLIDISKIDRSGGTQSRAALNEEVIAEYTEAMQAGNRFPDIFLVYDGSSYYVTDGFHRIEAALRAGLQQINASVVAGTIEDAQWQSYSVNKAHGLRRSNEDKRRAVVAALKHPQGAAKSDREIGRHVGVDHKTVASMRQQLEPTGEIPQSTERTGGDGRTINTAKIGSDAETLYPATPSDDSNVEKARQIALSHIGSNKSDAQDRIHSHQGSGSSEVTVNFGGGAEYVDWRTPNQRQLKYAREQVAVILKSPEGDQFFRFNVMKLMEWKLAQAEALSTRLDANFTPGQQVKFALETRALYLLNDGTYESNAYGGAAFKLGDTATFVEAFQQGTRDLARIQRWGNDLVVFLHALHASPELQVGDTVRTRTNHITRIVKIDGGFVYVEGDTRGHRSEQLTKIDPLPEADAEDVEAQESEDEQLTEQVITDAPEPAPPLSNQWHKQLTASGILSAASGHPDWESLNWLERWQAIKQAFCPNAATDPFLCIQDGVDTFYSFGQDAEAIAGAVYSKVRYTRHPRGSMVTMHTPALRELERAGATGVISYRDPSVDHWSFKLLDGVDKPLPSLPLSIAERGSRIVLLDANGNEMANFYYEKGTGLNLAYYIVELVNQAQMEAVQ